MDLPLGDRAHVSFSTCMAVGFLADKISMASGGVRPMCCTLLFILIHPFIVVVRVKVPGMYMS